MKETKHLTTECFKDDIIPLIEEGLTVPLMISGGSMEPFLAHKRDTIFIERPVFPLKRGDMAFFHRGNGQIVMHRVYKVRDGSYYFIGDGQRDIEGPVSEENIFGAVKVVERKGKRVDRRNFIFWFFAHVWIRIVPCRPFIMKIYRAIFS